MPSLTQLQYILTLHRHGHFGDAARACHVSQPTLSAQIKKAEEELGFTIFARDTKPISATEKGLKLVEEARLVLAAHERLMQLAKGQFEALTGELTLGVIPTLAPYVAPWFVPAFAAAYPQVDLVIVERPTEEMVQDIRRMRLDVGLLATPLSTASLEERVLFYDPFYVYAAPNEPLLLKDEVTTADLESDRLWLLEDGHCVRNQALALCELGPANSFLPSVRFEAGSLETLRHLIDASQGYTVVPETFARLLPRSRRLAQVRPFVEPGPAREVSLVHPKRTWKSELINALEDTIRETIPRFLRRSPDAFETVPVGV